MRDAILLSFRMRYRTDGVVVFCALSLVNTSANTIWFTYECKTKNQILITISPARILSPNETLFLHEINWECFSEKPEFIFSVEKGNIIKKKIYKPKPKDLIRQVEYIKNQPIPVFNVPVIANFLPDEDFFSPSLANFHVFKSLSEGFPLRKNSVRIKPIIDLHIGKDVKEEDIGNRYPLEVKMQIFEKHFWEALNHNLPNFTVIHGKGDGILRESINKFLTQNKYVKKKELFPDGGAVIIYF